MTDKKNTSPKKTMASEIAALITPALDALKKTLGEKKFEKRVKKAAKLLAHGIKTPEKKKTAPAKPAVKKAARKKTKKAAPKKIPVTQQKISIKAK
jgi:hypothetical protein